MTNIASLLFSIDERTNNIAKLVQEQNERFARLQQLNAQADARLEQLKERDQVQKAIIKKQAEDIENLRKALQYYTNATQVDNWGDQKLYDDGELARKALRLPNLTEHEFNMNYGQSCDCDVCEAEAELREAQRGLR